MNPSPRQIPRAGAWLALLACLLGGCAHAPPRQDITFSYYHAPDFPWQQVARVVVLPPANETPQPQATEEIHRALHAELQQLGLFEVVPVPPPLSLRLVQQVRETGRFNEADIVELARCTGANVILAVTLSHYSPYFRPRIGLTLQAISPDLGRVVASVDGLWDCNNLSVADRARAYYTRNRTCAQHVCDCVLGVIDDAYGADTVLESPHLFGRFVCAEAVRILVGDGELLARLRAPRGAACPRTPAAVPVRPLPPGPAVNAPPPRASPAPFASGNRE